MFFKSQAILQKICIFFLACLLFSPISVSAAQFSQPDSTGKIVFNNPSQENIYGAGNTIEVTSTVLNDAVVAGQFITFSPDANVTGSIFAVGQDVKITPRTVGSSARVFGQNVTVSGYIRKDVVVIGQTIWLKDATVAGDLIVTAERIVVGENVVIQGSIYASANLIEGNLTNTSGKNITINTNKQSNDTKNQEGSFAFNFVWAFYSTIGSAIVLAILTAFLLKKKKLALNSLAFNNTFAKNLLVGSVVFFLTFPAFLISLVFTVGLPLLPIVLMVYILFAVTGLYVPIYIANMVNNIFKPKLPLHFIVGAVFVISIIFSFIPFVNFIWGVLIFIFSVAAFGFVLQQLYTLISSAFNSQKQG